MMMTMLIMIMSMRASMIMAMIMIMISGVIMMDHDEHDKHDEHDEHVDQVKACHQACCAVVGGGGLGGILRLPGQQRQGFTNIATNWPHRRTQGAAKGQR
jgi:uridylate kinase